MAKTGGSKSKKTAKKPAKRPSKKGPDKIELLLNEIRRRNQTILKEARKIDVLLSKAKPVPPGKLVAEDEDPCVPPNMIINGGG